jgi:hypothetical protein
MILFKKSNNNFYEYIDSSVSFLNNYILNKQIEPVLNDKWMIGVVFSFIIFIISLSLNRYWVIKLRKKGLSNHLLQFCHTFYLRNELKFYLINEDKTHAANCWRYIRRVKFPYNEFVPKNGSERNPFTLTEIKNQLKEQFEHIKFDDESNLIIDTMEGLKSKVLNRLKYNIDIKVLKNLFNYQAILQFSVIKPGHSDYNGKTLKESNKDYLMKFINELGTLTEVNNFPIEQSKINHPVLKNLFSSINSFFTSSNVFVKFFSWLILLFILCYSCLIIMTNVYNVKIDSTIVVAFISIPFLGAFAFSNSSKRN